jgi:RND family efflux transporter MFP subunit
MPVALAIMIVLWWLYRPVQEGGKAGTTIPTVAVAKVDREDLYKEVPLYAEFRPYLEVELHAKVSGYLQTINVDFGDKVKAGQLLATLEIPELKDELNSAIAAEQRAEADYTNAHLVYTRLVGVNQEHANLVAQQDIDTAQAKDSVAIAAVAAAKADVEKYQTLFGYTQITAPFDGVITHRYADPGALIQAGTASDTQARPLVRLSDNYRLRLDFPVSVEFVKDIQVGDPVEVKVESLGGKKFTGAISRFTREVNDETRKMNTEIEVANPNLELTPGMYATVVLKVERRAQSHRGHFAWNGWHRLCGQQRSRNRGAHRGPWPGNRHALRSHLGSQGRRPGHDWQPLASACRRESGAETVAGDVNGMRLCPDLPSVILILSSSWV